MSLSRRALPHTLAALLLLLASGIMLLVSFLVATAR